MDKSLQRIQAAITDGRSRTPRYIQKQLTILHDALVKITSSIHQAIIKDTGCSSSEAWYEIHLTLKAVKHQFTAIDFKHVLEQEYSLAEGRDNRDRRIAIGCVYIVPSQYSHFYSAVQPIAAAIAAGNCVVIELQQTLRELGSLLRKTLTSVMDKDTFAIVDGKSPPESFFTEQVVILNGSSDSHLPSLSSSRTLKSTPKRTIAVVDRSADIGQAAREIVRARFSFGGRSHYAPDVVFVNEFALKEFCQAAVRALTEGLTESVTANGTTKSHAQSSSSIQQTLQKGNTIALVSGHRGSIHLLKQRNESLLTSKITEPVLVINPTTSLDDSIDSANTTSSLAATYLFADPKATKYLSQFILSDVSFTNYIPSQLLVGPQAPQDYPLSLETRYTTEMFSRPSPEFINPASANNLTELLDGTLPNPAIDKLKTETHAPLPDMGEPTTTTVGYFEQGFFTGLAINSTLLLSAIGVGAYYGIPAVMRRVRG